MCECHTNARSPPTGNEEDLERLNLEERVMPLSYLLNRSICNRVWRRQLRYLLGTRTIRHLAAMSCFPGCGPTGGENGEEEKFDGFFAGNFWDFQDQDLGPRRLGVGVVDKEADVM